MGIRVFHCDDSEAFTRLVAFWLADRPDVILLDTMGRHGDQALLGAIRAAAPYARVIVYSGYVRLMRDGTLGEKADAYLEKGDDEHALVALIREVFSTPG